MQVRGPRRGVGGWFVVGHRRDRRALRRGRVNSHSALPQVIRRMDLLESGRTSAGIMAQMRRARIRLHGGADAG